MTTRMQFYRYDVVKNGQVTLTLESAEGGVIERARGKIQDMHKFLKKYYPHAHNYRHHFQNEDGCPECERGAQ